LIGFSPLVNQPVVLLALNVWKNEDKTAWAQFDAKEVHPM
jgi:hypothetical protein